MEQKIENNELCEYATQWLQQCKEQDIRYFVLKIEDFLKCLTEEEILAFDEMLQKYNTSRLPKPINEYLLVNRDDYPSMSRKQFFECLKPFKEVKTMQLIVQDKLKSQLRNCYEIEVEFMFGDADGEEVVPFIFSDEQYKRQDFKQLTHDFIKSILSCIRYDSQGRGGFDFSSEAIKWYGLGIDYKRKLTPPYQWGRFCMDSTYGDEEDYEEGLLDMYEDTHFSYAIPTYSDGWYGSYHGINIYYYDNDGYKYNVEINEEN